MDVLRDHLTVARASGGVFARSTALPPWGLRLSGSIQLAVHTVVKGRAWLWLDDSHAAIEMAPGDVLLVRGGPDHHLADQPTTLCFDADEFRVQHAIDADSPDHRASVFLCGAYRFSGDVGQGLLKALPPIVRLPAAAGDPLHDVIGLVSRELAATSPAPGQQTILDRLLDVLLVLAIRASFQEGETAPRWYQASSDPTLSLALQAMHADASHPWTVAQLAALSGLSRAAFSRRFQQSLGQAPMQYLTDWRMSLARDFLRRGELTLTQIAGRTGYTSPYAFAAAFRRHHDLPPGRWRDQEVEKYDEVEVHG